MAVSRSRRRRRADLCGSGPVACVLLELDEEQVRRRIVQRPPGGTVVRYGRKLPAAASSRRADDLREGVLIKPL